MTTAAIDVDMLNQLFDNQKNLDDIFNEDFLFDPIITDDYESESSDQEDDLDIYSYKDMRSNSMNKPITLDYRRAINLFLPIILEVAIIASCIKYFN